MAPQSPFPTPALILAADHRARGVMTVEPYQQLVAALAAAFPHCDGLLASVQPLEDLRRSEGIRPDHRFYLSLNRTGLAGSAFELDDRLVTTVARAADQGLTGIKHMTRIDLESPITADALELLGRVLEESRQAGLEALIEPLCWRQGTVARDVASIVYAAAVAHDMGAPVLKVPVPDEPPGARRAEAVARVVASVGVPVLFLGGPKRDVDRRVVLEEVADVMDGGGAGMALGRVIYQDGDPAGTAQALSELVHRA